MAAPVYFEVSYFTTHYSEISNTSDQFHFGVRTQLNSEDELYRFPFLIWPSRLRELGRKKSANRLRRVRIKLFWVGYRH